MQPPRGRPPPRPVFPSPSCWSARSISVVPLTVQGYFERWVADKVPPEVRRAQANDYCRHMQGYVLPVLGDMPLEAVMARDILGLRNEVLLKARCRRRCGGRGGMTTAAPWRGRFFPFCGACHSL